MYLVFLAVIVQKPASNFVERFNFIIYLYIDYNCSTLNNVVYIIVMYIVCELYAVE